MFDGDAGVPARRLEADFDFGGVVRPESRLAPADDETFAGRPDTDGPDLEVPAVGQALDQPAAGSGCIRRIERHEAGTSGGEAEKFAVHPPGSDLLGERLEGLERRAG